MAKFFIYILYSSQLEIQAKTQQVLHRGKLKVRNIKRHLAQLKRPEAKSENERKIRMTLQKTRIAAITRMKLNRYLYFFFVKFHINQKDVKFKLNRV